MDISDDMTAKELDKRIHERHTNGVNEDIRDIMVKGDVAEIDHGEELEEHREVGIPGLLVSRGEEGEGKGKEGRSEPRAIQEMAAGNRNKFDLGMK